MNPGSISPHAVVQSKEVGAGVTIGEFAIVRAGARIGEGAVIHPHAVISEGVSIGAGAEVFPGAFVGKEPKGAGALARQPAFERRVIIGDGCSIGPNVVIYYDVEIGAGPLIGDGASIREQGRIGQRCILSRCVTVNYNAAIGDRTKIMDSTHVTGNCRIGSDVFISLLVGMANDNAIGAHGYSDEEEEVVGPTIEDGAMIGVGAILLPGVRIGAGAIVAAGATVSKNVEARTLVAGAPARVVRRLDAVEPTESN